jgi:hypothetical protein
VRRLAFATLCAGFALVGVASFGIRAPMPLYDGVVVVEPYRWLDPPPGQKGGAQGATGTEPLENGASPLIAIATPEEPPQAQIFGPPQALVLAPDSRSIVLSIMPVRPQTLPFVGHIAGNVYRILVADQLGTPLSAPASAEVSIVLRGPGHLLDATVERFADGAWQPLKTVPAGFTSMFLAVVTDFGDFALVAPGGGTGTPTPAVPSPEASIVASPAPTPPDSGGGDAVRLVALTVLAAALVAGTLLAASARRRRRVTGFRVPPPRRR